MATRRFQVSRGKGALGKKIATISFEDFRTATLLEYGMSPKREERERENVAVLDGHNVRPATGDL